MREEKALGKKSADQSVKNKKSSQTINEVSLGRVKAAVAKIQTADRSQRVAKNGSAEPVYD